MSLIAWQTVVGVLYQTAFRGEERQQRFVDI